MSEISSPCVRNCCLDTNNICLGCFRSIEEIMKWSNVETNSQQKQQILCNSEARKATHHATS
ncbi:MAG: DUF1289 domain-containing protein [Gammaproteobacteria bacterium]|nr:MAG: DUF1289 domain-containing protein [Gammaproteobacteria bacterium]RKZ95942.1 MAG: DUF1289 domain-containing protein [Gammaproteobacteria bacterium]RKZ97834.1 MAG: DUF1289 domain-containing protein [Gammaproteobacteria bacterium]